MSSPKSNWLVTNFSLIEVAFFKILLGIILYFDNEVTGWQEHENTILNFLNYAPLMFIVSGVILMIIILLKQTNIYLYLLSIATMFFVAGMIMQGYARPPAIDVRPTQALVSLVLGLHLFLVHLNIWTQYIYRRNRDEIETELEELN